MKSHRLPIAVTVSVIRHQEEEGREYSVSLGFFPSVRWEEKRNGRRRKGYFLFSLG